MNHFLKRIGLVVLAGTLSGVAASGRAQHTASTPPALATFDEDVAVFRRVLRQYCAVVQQMASQSESDASTQRQGLELLAQARPLWTTVRETYDENPPAEYAADRAFKARLRDIDNAAEDMERALKAGDARRAMLACGFACGLFVRMHEENNLSYALDTLFHLRYDIRITAAVMRVGGMEAVRTRLPGLLQKRDAVLMAPPPFPAESEKSAHYSAAVEELSRALDRLDRAAAAGDAAQVREILSNGVQLVNKPYGIVL